MASYDPRYTAYPVNGHIDAYNAPYIPQKPMEEQVPLDASLAYNQGYMWNPMDNVPGVMDHQQFFLVYQDQVVVPTELWQRQLDHSNASNAHQLRSLGPQYGQPQQTYNYQPEQHSQVYNAGAGVYSHGPVMSPPVNISPNYSTYTNQYPQSWASNLSTTPPNEYHSSGSDGGSDDMHSHVPPVYPPATPTAQWLPAPTLAGPEFQDEPEPEQAGEVGKKSYYRPRHLKNVSNITRSLVRDEDALSPRPNGATPWIPAPSTSIISKKKKACTSCKKRKISCAPPTVGVKCNQCQRTGLECDLA